MTKKDKTVVVSGFFDPLHVGHLKLFTAAKALGTKLVVIVNNDRSTLSAKGYVFMPEEARLTIIQSLRMVDEVVLSVDEGSGVAYTLALIGPDIFAKGPDYTSISQLPKSEVEVCKEHETKILLSVGGEVKLASSSDLVRGGWESAVAEMTSRSFDV